MDRQTLQCESWTGDLCRKGFTTLGGLTKRSVEDAVKKKTRRSPGFSTARRGVKSETRFRRVWEKRRNKEQTRRSWIGSGKEAVRRIFWAEVIGGKAISQCGGGCPISTEAGGMPVECFRKHVATDGSLLEVSGRWSACGWSVVKLDHDDDMIPMLGMYGTLDAELEVQRTIKRAEFLCLLRRTVGPTTAHVDSKGIINGLRRVEMSCIGPTAKSAELWLVIWQEVRLVDVHQGGD